MPSPTESPAVICDITDATDTPAERLAEYRRLFALALIGREHTDTGIRFRFREDEGVYDWVADLASREQACCPFFIFTVTSAGGETSWDASVIDDPIARQILEEFYLLPDTVAQATGVVYERFQERGLDIVVRDGDTTRRAASADLGIGVGVDAQNSPT